MKKNSKNEGRDYRMQATDKVTKKKALRLFSSECVTVGHP